MPHAGQQPLPIVGGGRVLTEGQKMATEQRGLIALAADHAVSGLMAFQCAQAVALAFLLMGEVAGVGVAFKRAHPGGRMASCLEGASGFFEIVIAGKRAVGARVQAHLKVIDRRALRNHAAPRHVGRRRFEWGKRLLLVTEYQHMAVRRMFEVIVKTFFKTQALDEVQVRLAVLHAIVASWVIREPGKHVGIVENAVFLEHLPDDLLHGQALENPVVGAMCEVSQPGDQRQAVMREAFSGAGAGNALNLPVNAVAR